ncbi:Aste57867_21978 [Aphanomyces stellatus]|uniref:Aste57867_21978 protein n=1 Tax=Aphanomyces stellatus TaxID=120398 RepID=A0A485LJ01_9STRA|nr:hypothetical protein As57867_021909 [Aphanomyces stellatus]VFT98646.1 Aste57867_21978 [Aphanomyces stellatus]
MMNALGLVAYGSDSDSESDVEPQLTSVPPPKATNTETAAIGVIGDVVAIEDEAVPFKDSLEGATPPRLPMDTSLPPLPDLPAAPCDPATQAKIDKYLEHTERGLSFIASLRSKKEFDNPYILAKVVEYFGIEEMQSNFPKDSFDPYGYDLDDYTDKLTMAVAREQERRAMLVQQNPALRWTLPNPLL